MQELISDSTWRGASACGSVLLVAISQSTVGILTLTCSAVPLLPCCALPRVLQANLVWVVWLTLRGAEAIR
jgi:hypothetical protein